MPVPAKVNPPAPENTPESMAEPEFGAIIVPPALNTLKARLELSPLFSTSVPPANTGAYVTLMFLRPTLVPLVMFDSVDSPLPLPLLHTLQAVMVRFQISEPAKVSVNVNEYPFEVSLKVVTPGGPRRVAVVSVKTEVNSVLRIEVLVVEKDDIPKTVVLVITPGFP